ncbi:MAG: hypothetical protein LPH21_11590, partial [Shewanella sp.]|nr:hypothetical protein [Shewanella sp.]
MQNPAPAAITPHDIELMRALLLDGMPASLIAEKFETVESEVIQRIYPTPFYVDPITYTKRRAKGVVTISDDCIERKCFSCNDFYPLTNDFWHLDKKSKDGLFYQCKSCRAEAAKNNRK